MGQTSSDYLSSNTLNQGQNTLEKLENITCDQFDTTHQVDPLFK